MTTPTSIYSSRPPPIAGGAAPLTHHEWRTASNSAQYLLPVLHSLRDENSQLKILDVGCGSGSITATLALEIPNGHVMGVDINPAILERARLVSNSWKASNVSFQEGNVATGLPFEDASFDVVHCHQVLAWLKEPWAALKEMLRICKPGGIIAAREGDLRSEAVWPKDEALQKFHDMTEALMRLAGGSPEAGRQLLGWALKAGVKRENVTVSWGSWGYSDAEEKKAWSDGMIVMLQGGRMRDMVVKSGLATEEDLTNMISAWEKWYESEDATLSMMSGEVLIRKQR